MFVCTGMSVGGIVYLMGTKIQWVQKYSCNLSKSNTKVAQHKITQYKLRILGVQLELPVSYMQVTLSYSPLLYR